MGRIVGYPHIRDQHPHQCLAHQTHWSGCRQQAEYPDQMEAQRQGTAHLTHPARQSYEPPRYHEAEALRCHFLSTQGPLLHPTCQYHMLLRHVDFAGNREPSVPVRAWKGTSREAPRASEREAAPWEGASLVQHKRENTYRHSKLVNSSPDLNLTAVDTLRALRQIWQRLTRLTTQSRGLSRQLPSIQEQVWTMTSSREGTYLNKNKHIVNVPDFVLTPL